jgi:hypothetical protein
MPGTRGSSSGDYFKIDGKLVNAKDIRQLKGKPGFTGSYDEAARFIIKHGTKAANGSYKAGDSSGEQDNLAAMWAKGDAKDDLKENLGLSLEHQEAMARMNFELTEGAIEANLERFPRVAGIAREEALTAGDAVNEFMGQQFTSMLDNLYPEWRTDIVGAAGTAQQQAIALTEQFTEKVLPRMTEAMDTLSMQALSNVEAQLRGEINPDVAAALERNAAHVAQTIGVRGQAAQFLTARDFGLTSMDLQERGLANVQAAANVGPGILAQAAQATQMPVQTGLNVTNLMNAYRPPQADVAALYQNTLGLLSGQGGISGNTALQSVTQVGQGAASLVQNQMQFNATMANQNYWNSAQMRMQDQANDAALTSAIIGGVATIGGAMIGGPPGAAAAKPATP